MRRRRQIHDVLHQHRHGLARRDTPESNCSGITTRMMSRPNCGIERARVPRKMPIEAVDSRYSPAAATNSGKEPATGTCITS